jgi:hypothetical protein
MYPRLIDTDYIFDINMNIYHSSIARTPLSGGRRLEGKLKQPPTPKVPGSNPGPATKQIKGLRVISVTLFLRLP